MFDFVKDLFAQAQAYAAFVLAYVVARLKELSTYQGVAVAGAGLILLGVISGSGFATVLGGVVAAVDPAGPVRVRARRTGLSQVQGQSLVQRWRHRAGVHRDKGRQWARLKSR